MREMLNTTSPRAMGVLDPLRVVIMDYPEGKVKREKGGGEKEERERKKRARERGKGERERGRERREMG